MSKGMVFNIQKFCLNDGPGIRTTVFLKGCPLNCVWCHNPESQKSKPEIMYDKNKCVHCKKCKGLCRYGAHTFKDNMHNFDREKCRACLECANSDCLALSTVGKLMTVDDVMAEVLKDKGFYIQSGGGITISGGEPLLQAEFLLDILKESKSMEISTCVETCGYAREEQILEIQPYVDMFLYDFKESDCVLHQKYCGVGNQLILNNLRAVSANGARIILRCPVIPGYNDRDEHLYAIAALSKEVKGIERIDILPYHNLGVRKCNELGKTSGTTDIIIPEKQTVLGWIELIQANTDVPVIQG